MKEKDRQADAAGGLLSRSVSRRGVIGGGGLAIAATLGGVDVFGATVARAAGFKGTRPYKIGFLVPLTGPVAPEGSSLKRGFDLGVENLNAAGGIAGHPVQILTQDDQGVPAKAGTITKKFIQQEKVDLVIGGITGDEQAVAMKVASSLGVPYVFCENGAWMAYCGETFVSLGETSYQLLSPLIPFMVGKFGKKWALVGDDYIFPHRYLGIGKELLKKEGATVIAEEYAPLGTADWSSVIGKLKAAKPDVILTAVVGGDAIAFVKQATSLGLLPGTQITGDTLQPEFYPVMGEAVDGLFNCTRYTEEINTPANEQFKAAYKKKYGPGPIPLVATTGYYSLNFIKGAVEKAASYDPKAVFNAFKGLQAETMLSEKPLTIDPVTLSVDYPMYICQIQKGGLFKIVKDVGVVKSGVSC